MVPLLGRLAHHHVNTTQQFSLTVPMTALASVFLNYNPIVSPAKQIGFGQLRRHKRQASDNGRSPFIFIFLLCVFDICMCAYISPTPNWQRTGYFFLAHL